jgi:hypothetical protein
MMTMFAQAASTMADMGYAGLERENALNPAMPRPSRRRRSRTERHRANGWQPKWYTVYRNHLGTFKVPA